MTETPEGEPAAPAPIKTSILAANLQRIELVRSRVLAIARGQLWSNPELDPQRDLPLDDLCWYVANQPAVQQQVQGWMSDPDHEQNIAKGADAITDDVLEPLVIEAMNRLKLLEPPPAPDAEPDVGQ